MKTRLLAAVLALASTTAIAGDLDALARDLERVLGPGSVTVQRRTTTTASAPARRTRAAVSAQALVDAMNRQRAAYGLGPLRLNDSLSLAATDRVADMFEQRYFDHVAPDGTQPFVWMQRRGYDYRTAGENLAVGYTTADRVVSGWMNSPGHRANILGRSFDEIGIAVANGAPLRGYGGPTVVALYASR
ncbi:MAG TPA: CAP domain-containing protein [Thermoanaerobaculia bacterium]